MGVCVLWPPARVNVGWDEQFLAPLPGIPGIPLIPGMNSKSQEKHVIYLKASPLPPAPLEDGACGLLAGCWLAAGWLLAGCWLAAGWLLAGWLAGWLAAGWLLAGCWLPGWSPKYVSERSLEHIVSHPARKIKKTNPPETLRSVSERITLLIE